MVLKMKDDFSYRKKLYRWKLIDDHTGSEIMSDDVMFEKRGWITAKEDWDPPRHDDYPIFVPVDTQAVPLVRAEPNDVFVVTEDADYTPVTQLTWSTISQLWGEIDETWDEL
jgi:hypothetical protein